MQRRDFIKMGLVSSAAGIIGAPFLASSAAQADEKQMGGNDNDKHAALEAALAQCLQTGNACVAHCMSELAHGNKAMAECNKTVHDMLATCEAMLKLTSYQSDLAKSLAKICADACNRCADACHEHQAHWSHGMHLACKRCYESCLDCAKLCKAYA